MRSVRRFLDVIPFVLLPLSTTLSQLVNIQLSTNTDPQSETAIAIHPVTPSYSLAVWRDWTSSAQQQAGVAFTTDSWNSSTLSIISPDQTRPWGSDPSAAFDRNGNVFYCGIFSGSTSDWNLFVAHRPLDNSSWSFTQLTSYPNGSGHFADRPWIAVDNTGNTTTDGRVYVSWTQAEVALYFNYSTDHGVSFQSVPYVILSSLGTSCEYEAVPAPGPNKNVYVVYINYPSIQVKRSTDGGNSFSLTPSAPALDLGSCVSRRTLGTFRVNHHPSMVVTGDANNDTLHVVYSNQDASGNSKVHYKFSIDHGSNWSDQVIGLYNFPSPSWEFEPTIASSGPGRISIAYYNCDNPGDLNNQFLVDYYVSESTDGGLSFDSPVKITNSQSNTSYGGTVSDYAGYAAAAGNEYASWTDTRNANPSYRNNSDVYVTSISPVIGSVSGGWNMSSVPSNVPNLSKNVVWPTSTSPAWAYTQSGVQQVDPLVKGQGYWVRLGGSEQLARYGGSLLLSQTIGVFPGWNMIGSISVPIPTTQVYSPTNPPVQILTPFWWYNPGVGYAQATAIQPGNAYWVKISGTGSLLLDLNATVSIPPGTGTDPPPCVPGTPPSSPSTLTVSRVHACDGLYHPKLNWFASASPCVGNYNIYRRDCDQYNNCFANAVIATVNKSTLTYTDCGILFGNGLSPGQSCNSTYSVTAADPWGDESSPTNSVKINTSTCFAQKTAVAGGSSERGSRGIPTTVALEGNFPNPFNPATVIRYTLPEDSRITLRVFNVFGQEVATLANGIQSAGYKEATFDAASLPSGVYFYRLQVGGFVDVKKMVLMH